MSTYIYCQSFGDSSMAPWHIRRKAWLGNTSMCGRPVREDMATPFTGRCLGAPVEQVPDLVCPQCAAEYLNDAQQDGIPAGAKKMRSSLRTNAQTP